MSVRIAGYELEHRLGEGAHGTVWRARQLAAMGRPVALKRVRIGDGGVCDSGGSDRAEFLQREAQALTALSHPHIVTVHEIVEDDDGIALVMQLAAGGSLADLLARRPCTLDEVVRLAGQVGDALSSAHRQHVLHLDLKPSNVLLTAERDALLADFGVARWRGSTGRAVAGGSDGFAAPEVVAGGTPDERADVFGLGRLVATMLDRCSPAEDDTSKATISALWQVVGRATAPSPADRHPTAAALTIALRAAAGAPSAPLPAPASAATPASGPPLLSITAEPIPPAPIPPAVATPGTRTFGPRPPAPPASAARTRRFSAGRVLLGATLATALALAGTAGVLHATGWKGATRPPSRVSTLPAPGDVQAAAPAPKDPAPGCAPVVPVVEPTADVLVADIDGDGCGDPVVRSGNVLERNGIRFALGEAGDVATLGDWNCDGTATPGLWRPASGTAHLFDGWAQHDVALPAVQVIEAAAMPATSCD